MAELSGKSYGRVASVGKAAEVLIFLSDQSAPVSAGEVARALGIPPGTAYSQLYTLADARLVEATPAGFELGMEAARLWVRRKKRLESEMARIEAELRDLAT